ncbi:MAG: hypothetical protein WC777_01600 [Candidatus Gracilibacteria bacterium]|jgi:hypothetical protein
MDPLSPRPSIESHEAREAELLCLSATHKNTLGDLLNELSEAQLMACRGLQADQLELVLQQLGKNQFAQLTPEEIISLGRLSLGHMQRLASLPVEEWIHKGVKWLSSFSSIPPSYIDHIGGPHALLPVESEWLSSLGFLLEKEERVKLTDDISWPILSRLSREKLRELHNISLDAVSQTPGAVARMVAPNDDSIWDELRSTTSRLRVGEPRLASDHVKVLSAWSARERASFLKEAGLEWINSLTAEQVLYLRRMSPQSLDFLGKERIKQMDPFVIQQLGEFSVDQLKELNVDFFLQPLPILRPTLLFYMRPLRPSLIAILPCDLLVSLCTRESLLEDEVLKKKITRTTTFTDEESGQDHHYKASTVDLSLIAPGAFFKQLSLLTDEEAKSLVSEGSLPRMTCGELSEIITEREAHQRKAYVDEIHEPFQAMRTAVSQISPAILLLWTPTEISCLGLPKLNLLWRLSKQEDVMSRVEKLGKQTIEVLSADCLERVLVFPEGIFQFLVDRHNQGHSLSDQLVNSAVQDYNAVLLQDTPFLDEAARAAAAKLPLETAQFYSKYHDEIPELEKKPATWFEALAPLCRQDPRYRDSTYSDRIPRVYLFHITEEKLRLLAGGGVDTRTIERNLDLVNRVGHPSFLAMTTEEWRECMAQMEQLHAIKSPMSLCD